MAVSMSAQHALAEHLELHWTRKPEVRASEVQMLEGLAKRLCGSDQLEPRIIQ
jgi:hypothetical protein